MLLPPILSSWIGPENFKDRKQTAPTSRLEILALGLILALSLTATAGAEDYSRIVVRDPSSGHQPPAPKACLIPISMLESPWESWSRADQRLVSRETVEEFAAEVESIRKVGGSSLCGISLDGKGLPPIPAHKRFSISDIAGTEKNVLLGEIVGIEPAWEVLERRIATLFHVKVEQIIRGLDPIAVGDVVTYRLSGGSVEVRGVTLCSLPSNETRQPDAPRGITIAAPERERPKVLVLGRIMKGSTFFLNTGGFESFQVIDGFVHYPGGFSYYKDKKPEQLEAVLAGLQRISQ